MRWLIFSLTLLTSVGMAQEGKNFPKLVQEAFEQTAKQVTRAVQRIKDKPWRADALGKIAKELAKARQFDQTVKVAQRIKEKLRLWFVER